MDSEVLTKISPFTAQEIDIIVSSFAAANWVKPRSTFVSYLKEQEQGLRKVWLAFYDEEFAGYVTLSWHSKYEPFAHANIPEIMDLNVLPQFRGKGIGAALLQVAEDKAFETCPAVGIGVGLYRDYGPAQCLYISRGYRPDGRGVTYDYDPVEPGTSVALDDDLVLWFRKKNPHDHK